MQDEIDTILDKQDGLINRPRDSALCRHGAHSKCQNCLPVDPFDEAYLEQKEIKHMSFHSYLRKLQGFKKSNLNRYPLENISCKIKPNCGNHRPWPAGICDKCKPTDVTLNRQKYRHVDNISFENDLLVTRFLDSWRQNGRQRIGFLYGYYEQHTDVPLGIRAVAAAIYEPPQTANGSNNVALTDQFNEEIALVDNLAEKLSLSRVGWIFTDLVADEQQRGHVKCTRNGDSYFLSAQECITAGYFQSKLPNRTKFCLDGFFGSKFVTVVVTGDANKQIQLYGYQVSNQCSALVAANSLVPTIDAPELAYARESSSTHYVPMVNYMAKDEYGNDVRKLGRPLPVEYLIVDVPASMPKEPRFFFHASSDKANFPIENRTLLNQPQNANTVGLYCHQFNNKESFMNMVSDFHFLLYLLNNETLKFTLDEITDLCLAIRSKDQAQFDKWIHANEKWETFLQLMTGDHDREMHDVNRVAGETWACAHCTFANSIRNAECEMCRLPKA